MVIEQSFLDEVRASLPELPGQKRERFEREFGLSTYDASVLSASREMADYFEQVNATCGDAKLAANWVMGELSSLLNKEGLDIEQSPVSAEHLGGMILRIRTTPSAARSPRWSSKPWLPAKVRQTRS